MNLNKLNNEIAKKLYKLEKLEKQRNRLEEQISNLHDEILGTYDEVLDNLTK